jgi:hypothetical protein
MRRFFLVLLVLLFLFPAVLPAQDSKEMLELKIELATEKIKRLQAEFEYAVVELNRYKELLRLFNLAEKEAEKKVEKDKVDE